MLVPSIPQDKHSEILAKGTQPEPESPKHSAQLESGHEGKQKLSFIDQDSTNGINLDLSNPAMLEYRPHKALTTAAALSLHKTLAFP